MVLLLVLLSVTFESNSNLTVIEWWAFSNSAISNITIPASVTFLGDSLFIGCTNLPANGVQFDLGSQWYPTASDVDCSDVVNGVVTIPSSLTRVLGFSFFKCASLTSVIMSGNNILEIQDYAFYGSGLRSVTIPSSVTTIGYSVFHDSVSLSSVDFEGTSNLKAMHTGAFWNVAITEVQIPASVTFLDY